MLTVLWLAASAYAVDHEISAELGTAHVGDPGYDLFSDGNGLPSRGLRGVIAPHDRLGIALGWHHAGRGSDVSSPTGDFRAGLRTDAFTVGLKTDLPSSSMVALYVEADGLLLRGAVRFDDDPEVDDNPNQISAADVAPGFIGLGGVEFRIPQEEAPFTLGLHLAMGWGTTFGPLAWEDIGEITPRGFVLRSGVGLRF